MRVEGFLYYIGSPWIHHRKGQVHWHFGKFYQSNGAWTEDIAPSLVRLFKRGTMSLAMQQTWKIKLLEKRCYIGSPWRLPWMGKMQVGSPLCPELSFTLSLELSLLRLLVVDWEWLLAFASFSKSLSYSSDREGVFWSMRRWNCDLVVWGGFSTRVSFNLTSEPLASDMACILDWEVIGKHACYHFSSLVCVSFYL